MTTRDHEVLQAVLAPDRMRRLFADRPPSIADLDALALRLLPAWHGGIEDDGLSREAWLAFWTAIDDPRIWDWLTGPAAVPASAVRETLCGVLRAFPEGESWAPVDAPAGVRDGRAAIALPVWIATDIARCVDLLALDPADPARWARRTGLAGVLARPADREIALTEPPARIRLHRYPLDWLRGGPAPGGYCILDWRSDDAADLLYLLDRGDLVAVCDDDAHARQLQRRVRPRRPKLRIEVAA